jgi:hypothetical protein
MGIIKNRVFKGVLVIILILAHLSFTELNIIDTKPCEEDLELTLDNVKMYLQEIGVDESHIPIVLSQVVLETGWLKSHVCLEYNNLCGLYNSWTKDYYSFEHWSESLDMYYNNIYSCFSDSCYYDFIDRWGYAEDSLYVSKLKSLEHNFTENE